MPPDPQHPEDEQRDRDRHEPCSLAELRVDDDERHDGRRRRTERIDRGASPPSRLAPAPPVPDHPGLRERERREHPDHVQVNEAVRVRAVDPEQQRCESREDDDAVREHEAVAEVQELPRREAVAREQRREAREALERRVRREDQHEQRQPLHDVVHEGAERARREDRPRDLRHDGVASSSAARVCARRETTRRRRARSRSLRVRRASSPRSCPADGGTR